MYQAYASHVPAKPDPRVLEARRRRQRVYQSSLEAKVLQAWTTRGSNGVRRWDGH